MLLEFLKFILYSGLIVLIAKYMLVTTLRKLAESLNLNPKTVGNIAGYATSMPELLTVVTSSIKGLTNIGVLNVLSSNIINLIQYIVAVFLNKNQKILKNRAIMLDVILVLITIVIPILMLIFDIEINLGIIPIFTILYVVFRFSNGKAHKIYMKKEDELIEREIEKEEEEDIGSNRKKFLYIFYLLISGFLLFIVSNLLGITFENLCNQFGISQINIGILLGFITSIPELITFFESQSHYKKQKNDDILGVVEATNNLLTSNILNLFLIQSVGILVYTIF